MNRTNNTWEKLTQLCSAAVALGEIPIAALITFQGNIIAEAHNEVEQRKDATAHAEMLAIQRATIALGNKYLTECDLYVTLEPCAMCAGAIAHAKLRRLYFGAYDFKAGAVEHGARLFHQPTCHHKPEIYGGFRETEYRELLQDFFRQKR